MADPALYPRSRDAADVVTNKLVEQYTRWQQKAGRRRVAASSCVAGQVQDGGRPDGREAEERVRVGAAPREGLLLRCSDPADGAQEEPILFHFTGFGVPAPTQNGELWVFNNSFTQYIPVSLFDLQTWLGRQARRFAPSMSPHAARRS